MKYLAPDTSCLFIISSVIYFKDAPLSYSKTRSKYTPEERERQTIDTIHSIKKKLPQAKIVLVEAGLKKELSGNLLSLVDQYIYLGDTFPVSYFSHGKNKSLGEMSSLYYASKKIERINTHYIFKISGRYFLTENFTITSFSADGFTIKKYTDQMSTRLYGFNAAEFTFWQKSLARSFWGLVGGRSVEQVLYKKIKSKITNELETIGVGGCVAPDGSSINE
ncbi:MAG TPA: hypothetical protein VNY73_00535 [Bacteroidia bacterium]|jgi:hypothetical protein|nr:hypothetical protein [Bacteroidia bacterium]